MARFSLRNQKRISASFGEKHLKLILRSLQDYFSSDTNIQELVYDGVNLKVIQVVVDLDVTLEFYVIRKTYDVFNLAYKGAIGIQPKLIKNNINEVQEKIKKLNII